MAFYEQELAKLDAKINIVADKLGIVFAEESDENLAASPSLAGHLHLVPVADRTPKPNVVSPALPNIAPGTGSAIIDQDDRSLMEQTMDDGTPVDPAVRPEDEAPALQPVVPEKSDDAQGDEEHAE